MAKIAALGCSKSVIADLQARGHEVAKIQKDEPLDQEPQIVIIGDAHKLVADGQLTALCDGFEREREPGKMLILALVPKKVSSRAVSEAMRLPKPNRQIAIPRTEDIEAAIRANAK